MKAITVFCGSSFGNLKIYEDQAYLLGQKLAQRNIKLIYGGANVGLMGAVANGTVKNRGTVIGVLPNFLKEKEIAHEHLNELIIVETMHERKTKMNELSEGVITMPGGFGTLEEFLEMLTWAQLGLHKKPLAILNIDGFYDDLLHLVQNMVDNGFLKEVNQQMIIVSDNIDELLNRMVLYKSPFEEKWVTKKP